MNSSAPECATPNPGNSAPVRRLVLALSTSLFASACGHTGHHDADASGADASATGHSYDAGYDADSNGPDAAPPRDASALEDARADAASTGPDASGGGSCAGRKGICTELCEGGQCTCSCGCESVADCAQPAVCVAPSEPSPPCCGVAPECATDDFCLARGANFICESRACGGCVPGCTDDASCSTGYRCESSHHCVPVRCDREPSLCPASTRCAVDDPHSDAYGCLRDACSTNADCDGKTCVNGRCHEGLGRCVPTQCP